MQKGKWVVALHRSSLGDGGEYSSYQQAVRAGHSHYEGYDTEFYVAYKQPVFPQVDTKAIIENLKHQGKGVVLESIDFLQEVTPKQEEDLQGAVVAWLRRNNLYREMYKLEKVSVVPLGYED